MAYSTKGTLADVGLDSFVNGIDATAGDAVVPLDSTGSFYVQLRDQSSTCPTTGLQAEVIADIQGYYTPSQNNDGYVPISPTRLVDTRPTSPIGTPVWTANSGQLTTGSTYTFAVTGGVSPAPFNDTTSVVVDVTALATSTDTRWLEMWGGAPPTQPMPNNTSSMNLNGKTASNVIQVPVLPCPPSIGANLGCVSIYNYLGNTSLLVDLWGFYVSPTQASDNYVPLSHQVIVSDSRYPTAYFTGFSTIKNDVTQTLQLTGTTVGLKSGQAQDQITIPSSATAVVLEVVAEQMSDPGDLREYPTGSSLPNAELLSYAPANTYEVSNVDFAKVGTGGSVSFYNDMAGPSTDQVGLEVYVVGYFMPAPAGTTPYLGMENWWSYNNVSLGSGGTAAVNAADGNLVVSQTDSTPVTGYGNLGLELKRTYNSETPTTFSPPGGLGGGNSGFGAAGWTFNVDQTDQTLAGGVGSAGIMFQPTNGQPTNVDSLNNADDVVLTDADGTYHTYLPNSLTASGGIAVADNGLAANPLDITPTLSDLVSQADGAGGIILNPHLNANATLCVDQTYTPPAGVHLAMWRYLAVQGTLGSCQPGAGKTPIVVGYAAERPDGLRFEWSATGELMTMTSRTGDQITYRYQNPPVVQATPTPLGPLTAVVETSAPGCAPGPYPTTWNPSTQNCRQFNFTYVSGAGGSCSPDSGNAINKAVCVTDPAGRVTKYDLAPASSGGQEVLVQVDNPDGTNLFYQYGSTCSAGDGAAPTQLCSASDARGASAKTSFTYETDPYTQFSYDDPAGRANAIQTVTDRNGTPSAFSYSASTTIVDTTTISGGTPCSTSTPANCDQVEYTGIDNAGRVGETDRGTPAAAPPCSATQAQRTSTCAEAITVDNWDTGGIYTCRNPDNLVDNNLCVRAQYAVNSTLSGSGSNPVNTPDDLTYYGYTITGAPLITAKEIVPNPLQKPLATGWAVSTYGSNLQFWSNATAAAATGSYQITSSWAANNNSYTFSTSVAGYNPDSALFVLSDPASELGPDGNEQSSGWASYETTDTVDANPNTAPNVMPSSGTDPEAVNVCPASNTTGTNTGDVCETDSPDPSGGASNPNCAITSGHACTTWAYNAYGEKTQMTTPMVNAQGGSSRYYYQYFPDSNADTVTNYTTTNSSAGQPQATVSEGGWLSAVVDPTATQSGGSPVTSYAQSGAAVDDFVAYGYDTAGDVTQTWDRDATTKANQPVSCYTSGACSATAGAAQTVYNGDYGTFCNNQATAMPWRYAGVSVDPTGDVTCYRADADGDRDVIRPPRGVLAANNSFDVTQSFDNNDNMVTTAQPNVAIDPALGTEPANSGCPTPAGFTSAPPCTVFSYDGLNNKVSQTSPTINPNQSGTDAPVTAWAYDALNRPTATYTVRGDSDQSSFGATAGCTNTQTGLPAVIPSHAYVCTTTTSYDGFGDPIQTVDATGAATVNYYDSLGRKVITLAPANNNSSGATLETDTVYDAENLTIATCSPRSFSIGGEGNLLSGQCYSTILTHQPEQNGTCQGGTDYYATYTCYNPADKAYTSYAYRAPAGSHVGSSPTGLATLETTSGYDADGNQTTVVAPNGYASGASPANYTTTTSYNVLDRKYNVTAPRTASSSTSTSYCYDPSGDTIDTVDASGHVSHADFDLDHRRIETVDGYDGYTGTYVCSNGNEPYNQYGYDSNNAYSAAGGNVRTQDFYDADSHLIAVLPPDAFAASGTAGDDAYLRTWNYDADGRVSDAFTPRTGDPTQNQNPPADSGQQTADCTTTNRPAATYASPSNTIPTYPATVTTCASHAFYNAENEQTRTVEADNPYLSSHLSGVAQSSESYSEDGLKTSVTAPSPTGTGNAVYTYSYDADGRQSAVAEPSGLVTSTVYYPNGARFQDVTNAAPGKTVGNNWITAGYAYDANGDTTATAAAPVTGLANLNANFATLDGACDTPANAGLTYSAADSESASNQINCTVYNSDATVATKTDTGGDITTYGYDLEANPVTIKSPDANVETNPNAAAQATNIATASTADNPSGYSTQNGYTFDNLMAWTATPVYRAANSAWEEQQTSYGYDGDGKTASTDTYIGAGPPAATPPPGGYSLLNSSSDCGAITTSYDADERVQTQTGRPQSASCPDIAATGSITTSYNPDGQPVVTQDSTYNHANPNTVTTQYYLDDLPYTVTAATTVPGTANPTRTDTTFDAYSYDGNSDPTVYADTPPGGGATATTYNYNLAGAATAVTDPEVNSAATAFTYTADGLTQTETTPWSGGTDTETYGYNGNHQIATATLTSSASTGNLANWGYGYDGEGRTTSQSASCTATSCPNSSWDTSTNSYNYDPAGRLATYTDNGNPTAIVYDANGNRAQNGTSYWLYQPDNATCYNLTSAAASGQSCASPPSGSTADTYDPAGNLTADTCDTYTFDGDNRTASNTTTTCPGGITPAASSYTYDGLNRQVTHTSSAAVPGNPATPAGTATIVGYDGLGTAISDETIDGIATNSYQLGPDGTAQAVTQGANNANNNTQYLSTDGQGNITTTENLTANGQINCAARYSPFGSPLNPEPNNQTACATGTTTSDIGYQAGRRDQSTGTYQDGSRTYNPQQAAFNSPDQYTSGNNNQNPSIITDPLTADTYTYVNGNPLNFDDPTGHHPAFDDSGCWAISCENEHETAAAAGLLQQLRVQSLGTNILPGLYSPGVPNRHPNDAIQGAEENESVSADLYWYQQCFATKDPNPECTEPSNGHSYADYGAPIKSYLAAGGSWASLLLVASVGRTESQDGTVGRLESLASMGKEPSCDPSFVICSPISVSKLADIDTVLLGSNADLYPQILNVMAINASEDGLTDADIEAFADKAISADDLNLATKAVPAFAVLNLVIGLTRSDDAVGQVIGNSVLGAAGGYYGAQLGVELCGGEEDLVGLLCGIPGALAGDALGGWAGGKIGNTAESFIKSELNKP